MPRTVHLRRAVSSAQRRVAVVRLLASGLSELEMAARLDVTAETISKDIAAIREASAAEFRRQTRTDLAAREHDALNEIQRLAVAEYHRSRRPAEDTTEERAADGSLIKRTTRRRARVGDSRLLAIAQKSVEQRRQLLGLDAPPASIADADDEGAEPIVIEVTTRGEAQTVMRAGDARIAVTVRQEEPADGQPDTVDADAVTDDRQTATAAAPHSGSAGCQGATGGHDDRNDATAAAVSGSAETQPTGGMILAGPSAVSGQPSAASRQPPPPSRRRKRSAVNRQPSEGAPPDTRNPRKRRTKATPATTPPQDATPAPDSPPLAGCAPESLDDH